MNDYRDLEEKKSLGLDPLDAFSALGPYDLDPWRTETLRIRARQRFTRGYALAERRWLRVLRQTYRGVLEPAFVAGVSLIELFWALNTVFGFLLK